MAKSSNRLSRDLMIGKSYVRTSKSMGISVLVKVKHILCEILMPQKLSNFEIIFKSFHSINSPSLKLVAIKVRQLKKR